MHFFNDFDFSFKDGFDHQKEDGNFLFFKLLINFFNCHLLHRHLLTQISSIFINGITTCADAILHVLGFNF